MTRGRARRGFTLIEVLVAVIILLTGVVLALRIFPRGFDSFLETQQVQTSNKLLEDMAREFKEHPDTLPDGIYPLDADSANAGTAAGYFDFADLHAIDYRGGAGAVFTWLNAHRSPMVVTRVAAPATASLVVTVENTTLLQTGTVVTVWSAGQPVQATVQGVDPTALQLTLNVPVTVEAGDAITVPRWPLWQPVSVRAPRRIEGEKVTIPADVSQEKIGTVVSSTTNATDIVLTVQLLNPNAVLADMVTPGMQVMIENQVVDPAAPNRLVKVTSVTNPDTVRVANDGSVIKDGAPILVAVNFIPSYLPRFGPVQLPGHIIIDPDTLEYTSDDICIYDLRYRRVTRDELDILSDKDTELPNTFYYAIDYAKHMLYVLPNKNDRYVRISYYYQDAVTGELLYHVAGQAFIKKGAYQVDYLQATATPPDKPFDRTAPQGVVLVQGSEQINRAYVAKAYHSTANPYTLQSGEYYYDTSNPYLLGAICFAAADRGRKVKMDYVTADWGILHEDLTVDNTGTVGLGLPDPKIANRPTFPREAATWTLYGPMRAGNGVLDPVLALVDVRTGMRYDVVSRANIRGGDRATPYGVVANSGVAVPNQVIGVDLRDAERGRVKLGGLPGDVSGDWRGVWDTGVAYAIDDLTQCNGLVFRCIRNHVSAPISLPDGGPQSAVNWAAVEPDWTVLQGTTFRVFYRARRDWSLQVYKAPAYFRYFTADADALRWRGFRKEFLETDTERRNLQVPAAYAGQTVAVDYFWRDDTDPADTRLLKVTGELHVVPARPPAPNSLSTIRVAHDVAPNTPVAVRGASVVLRATWIQPRSAPAYTFDTTTQFNNLKGSERSLNERWQSRTFTIALPATKN